MEFNKRFETLLLKILKIRPDQKWWRCFHSLESCVLEFFRAKRQTQNTFTQNTHTSKLLILIISKTHQDYCIPHEYGTDQRPYKITLSSAKCQYLFTVHLQWTITDWSSDPDDTKGETSRRHTVTCENINCCEIMSQFFTPTLYYTDQTAQIHTQRTACPD